jgi:hypothetical protein
MTDELLESSSLAESINPSAPYTCSKELPPTEEDYNMSINSGSLAGFHWHGRALALAVPTQPDSVVPIRFRTIQTNKIHHRLVFFFLCSFTFNRRHDESLLFKNSEPDRPTFSDSNIQVARRYTLDDDWLEQVNTKLAEFIQCAASVDTQTTIESGRITSDEDNRMVVDSVLDCSTLERASKRRKIT